MIAIFISAIFFIGLIGSIVLTNYACKNDKCSVSQAATGGAMGGYIIGTLAGILMLHIAKG